MLNSYTIKQFLCKFTFFLTVFIAFNSIATFSLGNTPDSGNTSFMAMDVSSTHTLALMNNGTVWAWGLNNQGQCGINITNDTKIITGPIQVSSINDVKAIASGGSFSIALKNDGTVWTWGDNRYGEIGIGVPAMLTSADSYPYPTEVQGLYDIIAVDAGDQFAMALKNDGTVYTWGYNGDGALGNKRLAGFNSYVSSPIEVDGPRNVKAIYAGPFNAMALTKDGKLWAWGHASYILGERQINMTSSANSTPGIIPGVVDAQSVTIGEQHAAFLKNDGTVWTWGNDWRGTLGNGSSLYHGMPSDFSYTPIKVSGLTNIIAIYAGAEHLIALKDDGTVWGWGGNNYGQLGDGTKDDRNKPIKIPVSNVVMISAGGLNTMAMDNNGILKMSGDNTYGQLGDGTFANGLCKSSPQRVDFEYITLNPSTPGSNNSGENNSGISSPELFVNNVLRIAALLVIIIIVGAGVIFYIKKK